MSFNKLIEIKDINKNTYNMSLPPEIQYMIMSFVPSYQVSHVCKEWDYEIKRIRIKSISVISNWYKPRMVKNIGNTLKELIRYCIVHWSRDLFLNHPEKTVFKLELNDMILSCIPEVDCRKPSDVILWMMCLPIDIDEWKFTCI
jgi:hypothetical protein